MNKFSNFIQERISNIAKDHEKIKPLGNPFRDVLSLGELIDLLAIVNIKLYKLKDAVIQKNTSSKEHIDFREKASIADVRLCEERSRLKACIDKKLDHMIMIHISGNDTTFNEEVKNYG